jgi:hypothetical protein
MEHHRLLNGEKPLSLLSIPVLFGLRIGLMMWDIRYGQISGNILDTTSLDPWNDPHALSFNLITTHLLQVYNMQGYRDPPVSVSRTLRHGQFQLT